MLTPLRKPEMVDDVQLSPLERYETKEEKKHGSCTQVPTERVQLFHATSDGLLFLHFLNMKCGAEGPIFDLPLDEGRLGWDDVY